MFISTKNFTHEELITAIGYLSKRLNKTTDKLNDKKKEVLLKTLDDLEIEFITTSIKSVYKG